MLVTVYLLYFVIALCAVAGLAKLMYVCGGVVLRDIFTDRPPVAVAVNRLMVAWFCTITAGWALLRLPAPGVSNMAGVMEMLASKLGSLLVILTVIHGLNLLILYGLYRIGQKQNAIQAEPEPDLSERFKYPWAGIRAVENGEPPYSSTRTVVPGD